MPPRTQEARSDETRQKLLRATQRLLLTHGYSRITTPDIARAAGVSRGALTHHFPSKEDLLVRALAHQLQEVTEALHRFCEAHPAPALSTEQALDYLWKMMADGLFYTTLEYLPEARHNPAFREALLPVVREFHAALDVVWGLLAAGYGIGQAHARTAMNTSMCLIRGMIAQTVLRDDPAYFQGMFDYWKAQLRADFLGRRTAPTPPLGAEPHLQDTP